MANKTHTRDAALSSGNRTIRITAFCARLVATGTVLLVMQACGQRARAQLVEFAPAPEESSAGVSPFAPGPVTNEQPAQTAAADVAPAQDGTSADVTPPAAGPTTDGQATVNYPDGSKYVGELQDGKRSGQGRITWASGSQYVGEWKNNEMTGQGSYTWPAGQKYVGEWKDGKRNGQGTYTYLDGSSYAGEWKDGKRDGQGIVVQPDGSKRSTEFRDDKPVEPAPNRGDDARTAVATPATPPASSIPEFGRFEFARSHIPVGVAGMLWLGPQELGYSLIGVLFDAMEKEGGSALDQSLKFPPALSPLRERVKTVTVLFFMDRPSIEPAAVVTGKDTRAAVMGFVTANNDTLAAVAQHRGVDILSPRQVELRGPEAPVIAFLNKDTVVLATERRMPQLIDVYLGATPPVSGLNPMVQLCNGAPEGMVLFGGFRREMVFKNVPSTVKDADWQTVIGVLGDVKAHVTASTSHVILDAWLPCRTAESTAVVERYVKALIKAGSGGLASDVAFPRELLSVLEETSTQVDGTVVHVGGSFEKLPLHTGLFRLLEWSGRFVAWEQEKAKRVNCAANLKQIGLACKMRCSDYREEFPPNFGHLVELKYLDTPKIYVCPSAPLPLGEKPEDADSPKHCSYLYFGAGHTEAEISADVVLACDRPGNHEGYFNAVCGDGHIAFIEGDTLEDALQKNKLRLPPGAVLPP